LLRAIELDISIFHSNDENGVLYERGINVTLHLPLDEKSEKYYDYTLTLENDVTLDKTGKAVDAPLTFDDIVHALGIKPDEKIWKESTGFDSTTEDYSHTKERE